MAVDLMLKGLQQDPAESLKLVMAIYKMSLVLKGLASIDPKCTGNRAKEIFGSLSLEDLDVLKEKLGMFFPLQRNQITPFFLKSV